MKGYIHSIESCGTVDGPGIRYVVFFQGCPMRCLYCHNPDTWSLEKGTPMTVDEVLKGFYNNLPFYRRGGVTATGGEPLLQIDFLTELFTDLKKHNIHTCIDTSGITFLPDKPEVISKMDRLMEVTDLVMLDLKHIRPKEHEHLTGHSNKNILAFSKYLEEKNIPLWIRHVVVPGLTYDKDALYELGYFIGGLKNLKALDTLPYHSMGKVKYEQLHMDYPLKDTEDLPKEDAKKAKEIILSGLKKRRSELKNN